MPPRRHYYRYLKEGKCVGCGGTCVNDTLCKKCRDSKRRRNTRKQSRVKQFLIDLKSVPCADCAKLWPHYVMEFDHARGTKRVEISQLTSIQAILEELEKCDIICANCHKERGWQRKQAALLLAGEE